VAESEAGEIVHELGGVDADLGGLINDSVRQFSKDIGPYILAGMGQFAVVVPVSMIAGMVAYFGVVVGMMGGWVVGIIAMALLAQLGDLGAALGAVVMVASPFIGMALVLLPILPVVAAIVAPVQASLMRAIAAHQRGEQELSVSSPFDTATQDLARVVITSILLTGLTLVGLLFCYVGALAVPILFGFVHTLVVLHRRSPMEAFAIQFRHLLAHGNQHLMLGVLQIALGMIAGFVPVIGPMFMADMQVRAHRKLFGDGPEPVVS